MSAGNLFHKRKAAFDLREKAITTTYTVNVGGTADNFEEDRVITITNPAENLLLLFLLVLTLDKKFLFHCWKMIML